MPCQSQIKATLPFDQSKQLCPEVWIGNFFHMNFPGGNPESGVNISPKYESSSTRFFRILRSFSSTNFNETTHFSIFHRKDTKGHFVFIGTRGCINLKTCFVYYFYPLHIALLQSSGMTEPYGRLSLKHQFKWFIHFLFYFFRPCGLEETLPELWVNVLVLVACTLTTMKCIAVKSSLVELWEWQ